MKKKISKIVITGGPCAGKTTGMSQIENAFTKRGYKVLFIAEAATEMINGGITNQDFSSDEFQTVLINMQLKKEELYYQAAKSCKFEKVLIVCDRGVMDSKAFSNNDIFGKIIASTGKSEIEIRDNYDAVFHLLTAAKGAEQFYTLENNSARSETAEQAAAVDDRLINVWTGHPHFRIIGNEDKFDDKMKHLISEIASFLGEAKPAEVKKKYLIAYPNIETLEKIPEIEKVELQQTYLKREEDEKIQIRKRGANGNYIYYQTRTRIQNGQLTEVEKRLSETEYLEKLASVGSSEKSLKRTRYCLINNNQYFEIDIYPFWNNQAILNVELLDQNQDALIPEYVEVLEEITCKKEYLNSELIKLVK